MGSKLDDLSRYTSRFSDELGRLAANNADDMFRQVKQLGRVESSWADNAMRGIRQISYDDLTQMMREGLQEASENFYRALDDMLPPQHQLAMSDGSSVHMSQADDWLTPRSGAGNGVEISGGKTPEKVSGIAEGAGKFNEPIIAKTHRGLEVDFVNPEGNKLCWVEPNAKSIPNSINNAQNSKNIGVAIEGKVANVVQQNTEVTGFGVKVKNVTLGKTATDIDVMTNKHIIEVKKSTSVIKTEQMDRLVNPSNPDFFNYSNKKVILYIDEAIDTTNPTIVAQVNAIEQSGVTVVNSLEALAEVIK